MAASFSGATIQGLDNSIISLYDMGVFLAIIKDYFFLEQTALRISFRC